MLNVRNIGYHGNDYMNKARFRSSGLWKRKRAEILERDGHKCKICGNENDLQVHHIYSLDLYPELRLENTNLVTVCKRCHMDLHNQLYSTIYLLNKAHA